MYQKIVFSAGEEPLDLSNVFYLAMDWKNNEKCKPYVMVQSKELVSFQPNFLSSKLHSLRRVENFYISVSWKNFAVTRKSFNGSRGKRGPENFLVRHVL